MAIWASLGTRIVTNGTGKHVHHTTLQQKRRNGLTFFACSACWDNWIIILPKSVGLSDEADKIALEMALMLGGKKESSPSSTAPGDGVKEAPGDDLLDELEEDDETLGWSASATDEADDDADASP